MFFRVLVMLSLLMCAPIAFAQRAIPDDNLAYPVRMDLADCADNVASIQATGFFLNTASALYLVTARHVLFKNTVPPAPNESWQLWCKKAELLSYSRNPKETQLNHLTVDLHALSSESKIKPHLTHDVAVVQVGVFTSSSAAAAQGEKAPQMMNMVRGVVVDTLAPSGLLGVSVDTVEKFDQVLTANNIYVFGYPSSIGLQQFPQIDFNAPLLRKGIIAGRNGVNRTIVLDCMTFHGNSGGPVLEVIQEAFGSRFRVIGVISQFVPVVERWSDNTEVYNSGYSLAEPMDAVLELVTQ